MAFRPSARMVSSSLSRPINHAPDTSWREIMVPACAASKGASLLLEAVQILGTENHTFRVLIVGDGPERAALQKQVKEAKLGDRVQLLGSLPPMELETVLSRADVVVVPSLGGEVFGLVVAENMLRGIPVVASDVGALKE